MIQVQKPVKLKIPAGSSIGTKTVKVKVFNTEFGATAPLARNFKLTSTNGSCPGGTVTQLDADALRELTTRFQALYVFPQDPREQLDRAIHAVFDSWTGERAVAYRRINGIPDDWGTAVNVQQMVYGNKGPTSGSGVAFSRNEITGAPDFGCAAVSSSRLPRLTRPFAEFEVFTL